MSNKYTGPKNAMPQMSLFGSPATGELHNYFFALVPDIDTRRQLSTVADELNVAHNFNGSWVSIDRYHMTLHHLGHAIEPRSDLVNKAITTASKIQARPFNIVLDQFMCFDSKNGRFPCVATMAATSTELQGFWQLLKNNLLAVKLGDKLNNSFKPHATLLYNRQPIVETRPITPIHWRAADFVLIDSLVGKSEHIELGRWPLLD